MCCPRKPGRDDVWLVGRRKWTKAVPSTALQMDARGALFGVRRHEAALGCFGFGHRRPPRRSPPDTPDGLEGAAERDAAWVALAALGEGAGMTGGRRRRSTLPPGLR